MATPTAQRVGIWVILIVMTIGAVGVYFVSILANDNDQRSTEQQQTAYENYQKQVQTQAQSLSAQYYPTFSSYASRVGSFEKAPAQEQLRTEDLLVGTGEEVTDTTKFAAYYIGWNPDGKIFDQSIEGTSLKTPLSVADGLANASLIQGWKDGMKGMKIGGVRLLTIPSALAYKDAGSGADIPPQTPIRFVVMAIPLPEQIPIPQELLSGY